MEILRNLYRGFLSFLPRIQLSFPEREKRKPPDPTEILLHYKYGPKYGPKFVPYITEWTDFSLEYLERKYGSLEYNVAALRLIYTEVPHVANKITQGEHVFTSPVSGEQLMKDLRDILLEKGFKADVVCEFDGSFSIYWETGDWCVMREALMH
jgi:hypothetical protein